MPTTAGISQSTLQSWGTQSPDATLAAIAQRGQQQYQEDYIPVEDSAIATLNDTSMVKAARANTGAGFDPVRARARLARERGRYGLRTDGAQFREEGTGFYNARALNTAQVVNDSRINQFDRNRGFRNELINIGRGVQDSGNSMLTEAASLQTSRDNANRNSKAQASAQNTSTLGTLGSMALFAAMMM